MTKLGDRIMLKSKIVVLAFAVFFIAQPYFAFSGVPDVSRSEAFIAYTGPGIPSLLVVPDGNGSRFTEAHDEQGNMVDATITLFVRDGAGTSIAYYPHEDLWLESADGGMVPCIGGSNADHATDINGMTEWVNPLFAGGYSQGPVLVLINASALTTNPGLPLKFNSPDINGDGFLSLQDVSILSTDFYTGYTFRCDMNGDGALNLSDIAIFAQHLDAECL
jgi:hypothetical protein